MLLQQQQQQQRIAELPLSQRHDSAANQLSPLPPNLQNPAAYYASKPTRLFNSTSAAWGHISNSNKSDQMIKKSPLPKQLLPPLILNGEMPFMFRQQQQPDAFADSLMNIRTLPSFSELEKDDPQHTMVGADSLPRSWDDRGENTTNKTRIQEEEEEKGMGQMIHPPKLHFPLFLCAATTSAAAAVEGGDDKTSASAMMINSGSQHVMSSSNPVLLHHHSDIFASSSRNGAEENHDDHLDGVEELDSLVLGACHSGDSHSSSLSSTSSLGLFFPFPTSHGTNSGSGSCCSSDEEFITEWDIGTTHRRRHHSSSLFMTSPRSFLLGDRSSATTTASTTSTTSKAWWMAIFNFLFMKKRGKRIKETRCIQVYNYIFYSKKHRSYKIISYILCTGLDWQTRLDLIFSNINWIIL